MDDDTAALIDIEAGAPDRGEVLESLQLRLAAGLEPEVVAEVVLGEGLCAFGADTGSLCLLDAAGSALEIVAAVGYPVEVLDAWTTFALDADLPAARAVRTGEPVLLRSSEERDREFPVFRDTPVVEDEAVACLALRAADETILGALVLGFAQPQAFDEELLRDLETLTNHAATALARTTGQAQLAFIAETSARLASSILLDETLRSIGDLAVPRLADRATVYLLAEDGTIDAHPLDPEDTSLAAPPRSIDLAAVNGPGFVLRTGERSIAPVAGVRPGGEPTRPETKLPPPCQRAGTELVLPMRARSRLCGALALTTSPGRRMSRQERTLAQELAARAAVALDNAQLLLEQQRQRQAAETAELQLRQLQAVMVDLSRAIDASAVGAVVRDMSFPGLAIRSRGLWLLTPDRERLELADGLDPSSLAPDMASLPLDLELPATEAARTGRAVLVSSVAERDVRYPLLRSVLPRSDAFLVLPLIADGDTLGVLALGMADQVDELDLPFLQALAEQCAQALERSRLYERERAARERADEDRRRIQGLVAALQRSLLPPELPSIPGAELSARYLPGMAGLDVGGDFYDVFDTGGDWAIVIGDVCGKGPDAASLTAVARSTIRSVAAELRRPSQVIRKLNESMIRQEIDDRFCTVAYARAVPTAHGIRIVVCRGGHPAPLVRRRDGRVEAIGTPGPLIGVFPEVRVWDETAVLEPGDALLLYTDGVTEARRGSEQLGDDRLRCTLEACDPSSADSIATAIESAVLDFCGEPTDDTAILVLRVDG